MLAYIDAGTAAAIAAMATGGLAGAKVAVQSMFMRKKASSPEPTEVDTSSDAEEAAVEQTEAVVG